MRISSSKLKQILNQIINQYNVNHFDSTFDSNLNRPKTLTEWQKVINGMAMPTALQTSLLQGFVGFEEAIDFDELNNVACSLNLMINYLNEYKPNFPNFFFSRLFDTPNIQKREAANALIGVILFGKSAQELERHRESLTSGSLGEVYKNLLLLNLIEPLEEIEMKVEFAKLLK